MAADDRLTGELLAASVALENVARVVSELHDSLQGVELYKLEKDRRWLIHGFMEDALDDAREVLCDLLTVRSELDGCLTLEEWGLRDALLGPLKADADAH